MEADNELSAILQKRQNRIEVLANGGEVENKFVKVNIHSEFKDFSRQQIKDYGAKFKIYNTSGTGKISLSELKIMMEKLGAPQTHLALKAMIEEVDEDKDGHISFREFLLIFRKFAARELQNDSGLMALATQCEINVDEVGVHGAKTFFEEKIAAGRKTSQFEEEIRSEQEQIRRAEEEKIEKQKNFKARAALFGVQGKGV